MYTDHLDRGKRAMTRENLEYCDIRIETLEATIRHSREPRGGAVYQNLIDELAGLRALRHNFVESLRLRCSSCGSPSYDTRPPAVCPHCLS